MAMPFVAALLMVARPFNVKLSLPSTSNTLGPTPDQLIKRASRL
jgi:hypothetical protein